jgi:hypothetical protein
LVLLRSVIVGCLWLSHTYRDEGVSVFVRFSRAPLIHGPVLFRRTGKYNNLPTTNQYLLLHNVTYMTEFLATLLCWPWFKQLDVYQPAGYLLAIPTIGLAVWAGWIRSGIGHSLLGYKQFFGIELISWLSCVPVICTSCNGANN